MKLVMYCGVYAPWDHYPKFLRQSEVRNPMYALKGFFDANDIEEHFSSLKRWRHYVVNYEYYNDERFGPGYMLCDYELNIRLLECLYILLLDYEENSYSYPKITEEQLASEKEEWAWYPVDLSKKELLNPYLVIKAAFDEIPPEAFRDHLWEWINAALSKNAIDESVSPGDIITVYEYLVKMYSAAWLIFQRDTEKPFLKRPPEPENALQTIDIDQQEVTTSVPAKTDALTKPSPAEKLGLKAVVELILRTTPSVQLISHLGTHQDPYMFLLFIMVDHSEMANTEEIAVKIEKQCSRLVTVVAFVKKLRRVRKAIKKGKGFINHALWSNQVIYRSPSLKLPAQQFDIPIRTEQRVIANTWDIYGSYGQSLYQEALNLQQEKEYLESLFTIQQGITFLLIGLIKINTGYMPQTKDTSRLLKMTLLFTGKYWELFSNNPASGNRAFELLTSKTVKDPEPLGEPAGEEAINTLLFIAKALAKGFEEDYHRMLTEISGQ